MPKGSIIIRGIVVLVLLALMVAAALKIKSNMTPPPMPDTPPAMVTVAEPVEQTVSRYHEFTGTTEAVQSVEIRARVAGFLEKIEFIGNTDVEKGDLLFEIERQSYQAKRDRVFANLESSKADLARAEKDLERMEKAITSNSVSQQQVGTIRAQRDMAKAGVLASKASLAEADLELSYTRIHSPISGRISRHLVDIGNLIGDDDNTLLATIVDIDQIHVYFKINEKILLKRLKDRVLEGEDKVNVEFSIGLSDEEGCPHKGIIDYVDNRVDPETGTINIRGIVPNPDGVILPGMFVHVSAPDGISNNALLIQDEALGTDFNGKFLLVIGENNIVEQRPVITGEQVGEMRIITQGISKGEKYVVSGLQSARPGMPVTLTSQQGQQAAPGPQTGADTKTATTDDQ